MATKFTESKDGINRRTVQITLRLTENEIAETKSAARKSKRKWRDWLMLAARGGIEADLEAVLSDGDQY